MADKAEDKAAKAARLADEAREKARAADLKLQEDIRKAVFGATHDADGDPKPIVIEG